MIRRIIQPTLFATVLFSCQKATTTTPDTPRPDPSYLVKTRISYSYDAAGNRSADSSLTRWFYDPQNRPVRIISHYSNNFTDTSSYTYSASQLIADELQYSPDGLVMSQHNITYFNSNGFPDSSSIDQYRIDTIGGVSRSFSSSIHTVYYNDASGNDTMDISYDLSNGERNQVGKYRRKFINGKLIKVESFTGLAEIKNYSSAWANGNMISDTAWNNQNGTLQYFRAYTYTDVPIGGYDGYQGKESGNLLSSYTLTMPASSFNCIANYTYTFDDKHRVSTNTQKISYLQGYSLSVYTYY